MDVRVSESVYGRYVTRCGEGGGVARGLEDGDNGATTENGGGEEGGRI